MKAKYCRSVIRIKRGVSLILTISVAFICLCALSGCQIGPRKISMEAPGFIKTIDKPDMGVGEVVLNRIRIEGHWKIDKTDNTKATFMGIIGSIDYDDYGSIYDDPEREVTITFDWNNSHWSGTIPYNDKNGENKTLIVYTDAEQSVWVFESEDRVAYTPASNYDDYVPQICELLNIESK